MRPFAVAALVALLGASACAPKLVPVPVATAPRFPDYIRPTVPPGYASSAAALTLDRAWTFLQAGDFRSAERETTQALRAQPEFYPADAVAGYVELAQNRPTDALIRFDRALERAATDVSALTGRGHALAALERDAEAVQAYEAAVAVDPSLGDLRRRVEVLRFRGLQRELSEARQAARAGDAAEAVRAYNAAIVNSPESAFLYREIAAVERQHGDFDPAIEHYRKAVELEPGDAASLAAIAGILEMRGDFEAALSTYEEALAVEGNAALEARRDALRARAELARLPEQYRAIDTAASISRADLAALIGVRLAPVLEARETRDPGVVTDVRGNWAEPWIMATVRAGVIEPFANHTFQPRTVVRRVDLAQAISRVLPRVATAAELRAWQAARVRFGDVSPSHLAYPAASVAVASNVMRIGTEGDFEPSRIVTGPEAAEAIERLRARANLPASATNAPR